MQILTSEQQYVPCSCCGYLTLRGEKYTFAICKVCRWQEDEIQETDLTYRGGANKPSLLTARRNYFIVGAIQSKHLLLSLRRCNEASPDEIPVGGNLNKLVYIDLFTPFLCPCCGYKTFEVPPDNTLLICPVCLWTDDDIRPDISPQSLGWRPSSNLVNLEQARLNFSELGVYHKKFIAYARLPKQVEYPS